MAECRLLCAVKACDNYYYKTKDLLHEGYPITYHYFPRRTDLCHFWIQACGRHEELFKADICFVCSIHFRSEDFINESTGSISVNQRKKLIDYAVPTKNLTLAEIRSVTYTRKINSNRIYGSLGHQGNLEIVYSSVDADVDEDEGTEENSDDDELITTKHKFDKLLKDYVELKYNSKIEIEKLRSIIEEKDQLFPEKLMKILKEHLSETEIDLVMFLRKQKKKLADS